MQMHCLQQINMDSKTLSLPGVTILLVDDEPDILEITKLILSHYHAEVIAVASAAEGLVQMQKESFNIIISDIGMPSMDGYQFMQEVRKLPIHQGGQTPAIAMTAFNRPADKIRAIAAGFQSHLSKPVDLKVLLDTVIGLAPHQ
jgi:CheY-like chemotaxis protein